MSDLVLWHEHHEPVPLSPRLEAMFGKFMAAAHTEADLRDEWARTLCGHHVAVLEATLTLPHLDDEDRARIASDYARQCRACIRERNRK